MQQHQEILEKQTNPQTKSDEANPDESEGTEEAKSAPVCVSPSLPVPVPVPTPVPSAPTPAPRIKSQDDEVWHVVGKKSHVVNLNTTITTLSLSLSVAPPVVQAPSSSLESKSEKNLFSLLQDTGVLVKHECSNCHKKLKADSFSRAQLHKGDKKKCINCLKSQLPKKSCPEAEIPQKPKMSIPGASASMILLSSKGKIASKMLNKSLRKENKTQQKPQQKQNASQAVVAEKILPTTSKEEATTLQGSAPTLPQPLTEPLPECLGEWKNVWRSSPKTSQETNSNMGVFNLLNRDTAVILLSYLSLNEILSLGSCCRGTASLCDDWLVWRDLLRRSYPRTALAPVGPNSSWKTAFMLEANGLAQALTCFTSFSTKSDSVLGFPVSFTTNPKTGCLDYATSTFDILSFDAFMQGNVRKTVWGEGFTDFLPIYIDEDHFTRGLAQLIRVSRKIVQTGLLNLPKQQSNHFPKSKHNQHSKIGNDIPPGGNWMPRNDPEMVLTLLTKMMNTQVVLLCDKGIAASEVALMGYCQLHRMLLAVVDRFPQLRVLIRQRLDDFARKPDTRVKALTPSLGELLALLSVSDTYSWQQLSLAYLKESFDRSVLWACTKDPTLAEVTVGDESRLEKYLTTQRVSMRLTLFHAVFLNLLVQGAGSKAKLEDCADRYDTFQGRPPLYLRREWQQSVNAILGFDSWPQFFSISGIPLPSKSFLLSTLEQAVKNSLKKGYHSRDTVFQNVMKSGVSKILLKGETYSAAPNLKRIQLVESWRYDGGVVFLDASCLVYGFNGQLLDTVDYSHTDALTRSPSGSPVLYIQHSGDVIDYDQRKGQHTIHIDIPLIPSTVAALFFTVSAWTTTLKEIHQPSAQLCDSVSDTEMCRYKLEDQDTGDKTAAIMCKLHRPSTGTRWELTSIGHVGYGRAGNYTSIQRDIQKYL
jgi:stress response protein SCP2